MLTKFKTIQAVLFSTYSLIIFIVFTVLVVWLCLWSSDLLKQNATDSLASMGRSMQEHIDSEIQKMNDVSLNVMYSNLVKNHFKRYTSELPDQTQTGDGSDTDTDRESNKQKLGLSGGMGSGSFPSVSKSQSVENAKALAEILTAAIGPSRPVEQLYLYDFKNKMYGNGFDNGERTYNPATKPWFKAVVAMQNGKIISLPVPDEEMSRYISSSDMQYSVSLFRQFYDNYNDPTGIVEVKQYYNRIFSSILAFTGENPYGAQVLVYNDNGDIIYPLQADKQHYAAYTSLTAGKTNSQTQGKGSYLSFVNPNTGAKELLSLHRSELTGWNTLIIVSESKLLVPVFAFAKQTVLVAFVILLFAIMLSYAASKRITYPILKIHRSIRGMRLEDLGTGRVAAQTLGSGLNELDQLHVSFVRMSSRLKESMDDLLLSQSQEMQAKLVALQSQMNPHFLYNTLATIHAMAEENMNEQIVAMTENMSDFLRYFSTDAAIVSLQDELLHTGKFLDINQIRFGQKLHYEMEVDERMRELRIPKLVVQPLVENALKFGTQHEPPWQIRISGKIEGEDWHLEVADNGPGFSEESLAHLFARICEVDETHVVPVLKLGGMGLLNIYIRMKLTYGDAAVFQIHNRPEGGAAIRIGGKL
ncbi:cache domain-containing sensor histidine kinase [Paenibacillus sp. Leaf72]|uniref:cache domain-containing sensor histidine kinase n=1 Tax=Paenibacillus sp. Leaf72 TaxID=1736234 RepID=UPI00070103D0|nr:sensor histidine kinase [Paenibacillus sp. Leaf72]KQO01387.1 hypothetical protein ASF12_16310 [Paenibacillus sp. Leaf72]